MKPDPSLPPCDTLPGPGGSKGDQFVRVLVSVPKDLSEEQKKAISALPD